MKYAIRYTTAAFEDFDRRYDYLIAKDVELAERAPEAVQKAIELLGDFPFTCRKVLADNSFLRELVIPFGSSGYVALFEIENDTTVTVLAVRHQRAEDYH
ncbi:type II toxin-antitoxin system RelE/ParE family toxin [Rhizobium calliandrae]|uniref:Type II toxin-antitoxin system RelE/ParE family toxin n=1 Tax=Rhizobium calliandrae TaxID=1312182 RepID=A0ABT7KGH8_9HYPH|nr:type II toxin-antitoxin system RelE/ParE family toxin [Rhizobium calliandrae]MDL2407727.1 type II toxin-antitoxin system RelE/ParE family toxin [Rhizobium calliandrae]